jgi:hypothetical protein
MMTHDSTEGQRAGRSWELELLQFGIRVHRSATPFDQRVTTDKQPILAYKDKVS